MASSADQGGKSINAFFNGSIGYGTPRLAKARIASICIDSISSFNATLG